MHYKTVESQIESTCEHGTDIEHVLMKTGNTKQKLVIFLRNRPTFIKWFFINASIDIVVKWILGKRYNKGTMLPLHGRLLKEYNPENWTLLAKTGSQSQRINHQCIM